MREAAIAVLLVLCAGAAHAGTWRITKDHWSDADEKGFGDFVRAIGETDCNSSECCLRNKANSYRASDPRGFDIDTDCAKWPYMLRGYYAWKNGLPFSFVDGVSGAAICASAKATITRPRATTSPTTAQASTARMRSCKSWARCFPAPIAPTLLKTAMCCPISIRRRPARHHPPRYGDLRRQWPCRHRLQGG